VGGWGWEEVALQLLLVTQSSVEGHSDFFGVYCQKEQERERKKGADFRNACGRFSI
jgi:hypothetical protein